MYAWENLMSYWVQENQLKCQIMENEPWQWHSITLLQWEILKAEGGNLVHV